MVCFSASNNKQYAQEENLQNKLTLNLNGASKKEEKKRVSHFCGESKLKVYANLPYFFKTYLNVRVREIITCIYYAVKSTS